MNNSAVAVDAVQVLRVPGSVLAEDYKIYKPFIEASLEYETEQIEAVEVFHKLRGNFWLCLVVVVAGKITALCICEIRQKRKGRALEVMMLSGENMAEWVDALFRELRVVAKSHKCNALTLCGRLGWLAVLKRFGFKAESQSLRLEL